MTQPASSVPARWPSSSPPSIFPTTASNFLGEIDQKAMGWAFRAEDLNNYYAMKFVVVKPGPLPLVRIVRYAVINGKEGPHVDKPLPITCPHRYALSHPGERAGQRLHHHGAGPSGRLLVRQSAAAWRRWILLQSRRARPAYAGWKFRISTMRWADFAPILRPTESRAEMEISTDL